jgi:DNA-binding response OmpR family regulator
MSEAEQRRILLVDDDPNLLIVLSEQLRDDGFEVDTARDGAEAMRRLGTGWPDLVLLDLMMPGIDGLALAREIKAAADIPIIVVSAVDTADSKARLVDEVAEDYIAKPYDYPELRARVRRVLRRLGDRIPRQSLVLGPDLTLNLHRRSAVVAGREVGLTPTETRLLGIMAARLGEVVPVTTLLARSWTEAEEADVSYVWVSIRRLRRKIETDPDHPIHLVTVRGVGYRLAASE